VPQSILGIDVKMRHDVRLLGTTGTIASVRKIAVVYERLSKAIEVDRFTFAHYFEEADIIWDTVTAIRQGIALVLRSPGWRSERWRSGRERPAERCA